MSDAAPDVAVVIPTHRQSLFLAEAVGSVLAQKSALRIAAVIVDDGCPMPSTQETAVMLAARAPSRIFYLRRENGGLAAARNTGIDFVLDAWPGCAAIQFLDSDNRLLPFFIDRAFSRLRAANAGWAYPDIDMFGIPAAYSVKGEWSRLLHLVYNYCDAGSLVSRAVFERGVRFDQAMRAGYEDWDFWLSTAQAGFRGVFVPQSGFRYRRRAESMLTHADRVRPQLIAYMHSKHRAMLGVRDILRTEQAELPRTAVVGQGKVCELVDPCADAPRVSWANFAACFARSEHAPSAVRGPRMFAFTPPKLLELFDRLKLRRTLFWRAEQALTSLAFVAVRLHAPVPERLKVSFTTEEVSGFEALAAFPAIFAAARIVHEFVRETGDLPSRKIGVIEITPPTGAAIASSAASVARDFFAELRRVVQQRPTLPMDWRSDNRMVRREASEVLFAMQGIGTVLPLIAQGPGKQIGFLLPLFDLGGVEQVVSNYARVLKSHGHACHLFVTQAEEIAFSPLLAKAFDSLNFIPPAMQCPFDKSMANPVTGDPPLATRDAIGILATMDIVFNTHALEMHGLMAGLRALGARTYAGLHVREANPLGLPFGNPMAALDYEHVYDGFVVVSRDLRAWCLAHAIPAEKIILVPNAPAFDLTRPAAPREERQGPLRALYLGRLDAQKGIDRLEAIHRQMGEIEFRFVGKTVMGDGTLSGLPLEPPVMGAEALAELYAWADLVLLPSRFEGAPLTILEAQRQGCVPVATAVGAVPELIAERDDGFLIDGSLIDGSLAEPEIVARFVQVISELDRDRALLRRVSARAMLRAGALSWERNLSEFIGRI